MNNELIFIPLATLVLGGVGGYYMGRYQAALIDKIHKLEQTPAVEVKPIITMGAYDTLPGIGYSDTPVGIAEPKTPQLVEWEAEQKTEKQGRGL